MNREHIIEDAKDYARQILGADGSGHGYDHIDRVYRNAEEILKGEEADRFVVLVAALLHDVDDRKLFPENRNLENARSFLQKEGVDIVAANAILQAIETVSFKGKDTITPATIEGKIVQDADRLDAIGAIGIARAFAFGGNRNRKLYDERLAYRENLSAEEYFKGDTSTIAHFYEKLLRLKDMMNTKEGRRMAEERHRFLLLFLDEFYKETGYGK